MSTDIDLDARIEEITRAVKAIADSGRPVIGHFGATEVEGRTRSWWSIRYDEAIDKLLSNPDYKVAQILCVLGSEARLAILRALIAGPKTAAELVAELKMGTTGQAYHHLRELERAGYVQQREGGRYHLHMPVARVYLTALALAADAGAEDPEKIPEDSQL